MQLLVLVLLAVVAIPRLWGPPEPVEPQLPEAILWAWGPPLLAMALSRVFAGRAMRALAQGRVVSPAVLRWRIRLLQWMCVWGLAAATVGFGWVELLRGILGPAPLLVELAAMLPALLGFAACWWAWHPMEMALRRAMGAAGSAPEPAPSRLRFVVEQFRNEFGLLAVPLLVAIGVYEAVSILAAAWAGPESPWSAGLAAGSVVVVALLSPPLVVRVLVTTPLPPGEQRERVEQVLRDNAVRLRGARVWRCGGLVLNGVVLGLLPPWRYLLLTDGLLRSLEDEPLRAVVAHEAGHLRRHHLPWFAAVVVALLGALSWLSEEPLRSGLAWGDRQVAAWWGPATEGGDPAIDLDDEEIARRLAAAEEPLPIWGGLGSLAGLALAAVAVGWVSRRFERQADTFAVQYLSVMGPSGCSVGLDGRPLEPGELRVQPRAVMAMCRALGRVAELNGLDPRQPSFRHGSISFRQRHLASLVGQPLLALPVDREVRRIKSAAAAMLALLLAMEAAAWWRQRGREEPLPHSTLHSALDACSGAARVGGG